MNIRSRMKGWWLVLFLGVFLSNFMVPFSESADKIGGIEDKGSQYLLTNNELKLLLDKRNGNIVNIKSINPAIELPPLSGRIFIIDKKTSQPIFTTPLLSWEKSKNKLSFQTEDSSMTLISVQTVTLFPEHIEWKVLLRNKSDRKKKLKVGLELTFSPPESWAYWDGAYEHANPLANLERNTLQYTFPMSCIYNKKFGLSLGISPMQMLPLISGIKKGQKSNKLFYYATEVNLKPKGKEGITFTLYSFKPGYGFRGGLQKYYDIYPKVFSPLPDIDPRLKFSGGTAGATMYFEKYGNQELVDDALEKTRRFFGTWEWTFPLSTTHTRLGDYYGHKKYWPEWYPDRERQLKRRAEVFARGKDEVAMCFYLWLPGCEAGLAEKYYPDAIVRDSDGKPVVGYVAKRAGRKEVIYRVRMWGNKLAEDTKADLKRLVKELNLTGFAFDTCGGFDQARMQDYVHTLYNGKYRVGVIGNVSSNYANNFRMDVALLEQTPYGGNEIYHWANRYLLGHKMGIYWWGYRIQRAVDSLRSMSAEEIKEAYRGLRDYVILTSLQRGNFPNWRSAAGIPKMHHYFPIMIELFHTGWEPVVAMKLKNDEGIWLSRYGKGTQAFLCLGNPATEDKAVEVKVDNPYLGDYLYLFSTYEGEPIKQSLKGKDTLLSATIPARSPLILKSWLGIKPQGEVTATVKETRSLNNPSIIAKLLCSQRFSTPVVLRVPQDARILSVILNGETQNYRTKDNAGFFTARFKKGENSLQVKYISTIFASSEKDILGYPFVLEGKPASSLILKHPENADEQYVAWMLQNYFRFYYKKTRNAKVLLPIKPAVELRQGEPSVVIDINEDNPAAIEREGNILYIRAKNGDQAKYMTRRLLRILDKKYVWFGKFGYRSPFEPKYVSDVLKKKGLAGTILE